jgi:hypothetical protein
VEFVASVEVVQRTPAPSRFFTTAVGVSLALHLLAGWGFGSWRHLPSAAPGAVPPPSTPEVRFELVESPASAEVAEPPPEPRFFSDRNTRARDQSRDDLPPNRRPRVEDGTAGRDLRPRAGAPRVALPQPPAAPPVLAEPQAATPRPPLQEVGPSPPPEPGTVTLSPRQRQREEPAPEPRRPEPRPAPPRSPAPAPAPELRPATALAPSPAPVAGRATLTAAEEDLLASALERGELSYEATQHFFADYFLALKNEIETTWNLLLLSRYSQLRRSRLTIDFLVQPDGTLGPLEVGPVTGDELFTVVCTAAIRRSAPFGPVPYDPRLPEAVRRLPLHIRIDFTVR